MLLFRPQGLPWEPGMLEAPLRYPILASLADRRQSPVTSLLIPILRSRTSMRLFRLMSTTQITDQGSSSTQAVNEEYEKLIRFHVNRRRIVLLDDNQKKEGGFGIVRRAELHQSAYVPAWLASRLDGPPQLVAVKQIRVSDFATTTRAKRAFTREMSVWSSLDAHPGIAKFLGFYADFEHSKAWLLSPWEPNGNVGEFTRTHDLEVPEKLSLVYDTIDALTFLHQLDPPVCHGDIKSANVLVSADYKARLCDFGLARLHEDSGFGRLETSTGMKGSIRWCSPEILNGAPRAPTSDVYAWAWLVWEIMTGKVPYEDSTVDFVIMRQIFESPLPQVDGQSRLRDCLQVWELMTRCWNGDPQQRPTARMCKTTVTHLPRCTPTPQNADHQIRSAALLESLGDLESWKGNPERSSAYLDEALRLYQEQEDTKGITSVLLKQIVTADRISDYAKVRAIATTALEHCRALNDALGIAHASYHLGVAVSMPGELEQALPLLRESLDIRRAHGDDVGIVPCLERIGMIQTVSGQYREALSTLEEAVAVASRSGDRLGLANALHAVGFTHSKLSDFTKAADALSKAITITRNVGWEAELSNNLCTMGGLKMQFGEYGQAEEFIQESISIARRIGDRWGLARALEELGECLQGQSRLNEASSALEEACQLWQRQSHSLGFKRVALTLVKLKGDIGEWDRALLWHDHIIAVSRNQEDYWEVAIHMELKGDILVKAQRYDEAALQFEAAMLTRRGGEREHFGYWKGRQLVSRLCAIPKTAMKWERRLPLLCDLRKLQRRQPQLRTATLRLPIPFSSGEP